MATKAMRRRRKAETPKCVGGWKRYLGGIELKLQVVQKALLLRQLLLRQLHLLLLNEVHLLANRLPRRRQRDESLLPAWEGEKASAGRQQLSDCVTQAKSARTACATAKGRQQLGLAKTHDWWTQA